MAYGRNYYSVNPVAGNLGCFVCFFIAIYDKKNDKLDELQDAREKEYQKLLLQLTDKLAVVNAMNDKLDQLCNKSNETKL